MKGQISLVENFSPRLYQQSIFANSLGKNSLVVLPTGLGKTVISLMLSIYYFNQSKKKVLFLAPTKPLVEQQCNSYRSFIKDSEKVNFVTLTGSTQPKKREEIYKEADFIFSTPQLIENDIINRIIDLDQFDFVIFDECHRLSGNYAYSFIAQSFSKKSNAKFLALSASPGISKEEIMNIIKALNIENLEVKSYDDSDVKEFISKTKLEKVEVEFPETLKNIRDKLLLTYNKNLNILQGYGYLKNKNANFISKGDLLLLQSEIRKEIGKNNSSEVMWNSISLVAALLKLQYGIELLESQEIGVTYNYFYNFFREGGDSSKAAKTLTFDINFREAFEHIGKLTKLGVKHPKIGKLRDIVFKEISKKKNLKIIIFTQYRESAQSIVENLSSIKEVSPTVFVGQAKKGDLKLSQKDQKRILEDFRDDKFNVLVSTSVGEEGLDIPKVDLVIFYEPIASAIRSIQRVGRTGRFDKGNAYVLITKGTKDVITGYVASAKEKRMYKVLDEIKQDFKEKKVTLNSFIKEERVEENKEKKPVAIVDSRENPDLIKKLFDLPIDIETKRLDVGDIVISDTIAIERKSKSDFVSSILDKRLFEQLKNLSRNYKRPVLIVEGEENIYSLRNLNPEVIRATLSSIAVDFRIPIIYSDSVEESANMIYSLAKRILRENREISLVSDKRSFSENEELEKFISTIPKINVVSAKSILTHFKSIKELVNSSIEDIEKCEGIGRIRAKAMKEFFEREYKLL